MTNYEKLVEALRHLSTGRCDDSRKCELCAIYETCLTRCVLDAADAIEELTGFLAESERDRDEYEERMEKEQERVLDLQARLEEAENSVENYKRMWLEKHEPKVGRWIEHGVDKGFLVERYTCSNCDYYSGTKKTNFCPNCGAVMEDMCEVQDDKA